MKTGTDVGLAWPGLACVARVRPKVHRAGVPTRATHAGERLRMATGTDAGRAGVANRLEAG